MLVYLVNGLVYDILYYHWFQDLLIMNNALSQESDPRPQTAEAQTTGGKAELAAPPQRLGIVDVLRGVVIADMMLVHYDYLVPHGWLRKAINYSDFAMEGFLTLAGFMVGYPYLERYRRAAAPRPRPPRPGGALYGVHALMGSRSACRSRCGSGLA